MICAFIEHRYVDFHINYYRRYFYIRDYEDVSLSAALYKLDVLEGLVHVHTCRRSNILFDRLVEFA